LRTTRSVKRNDALAELLERGILVAIGLVLLQADGFRSLFISIIGSIFAIGPIVTIGPIESLLRISFNRVTQKVVGKEVFIVEQKNIHAQTVIGQHFGDIINPVPLEKDHDWNIARNFTLKGGDQEWEPFRIELKAGQAVKGYFDAEDDVFAYILTPRSLKSFERGNGFNSLWDASQGDYAEVDFVPERSGTYYFVVSNFDPEEEVYYDEDDNVSVQLRLRY